MTRDRSGFGRRTDDVTTLHERVTAAQCERLVAQVGADV
jgi:hypothetical protein